MGLLGGLALFLFGMEQMADSLKAVAGERMREILARLTTNRVSGAFTGALVTAVIQSSSVTTVLVVGFITAGLMSMSQSVGIIMGANVGTTITAQIIAFKITKYALAMVAIGFAMLFFSKKEVTRHRGSGLMGLGLIFFGMGVMADAMVPLRSYEPFLDWMVRMENPLLGIAAAALFTALIQSSSATTGIVIVMASQGLISLVAGIALIFGANVGTCITAILAAIGKPREALRAAVVHVLFNLMGVVVWIAFIDQLADWVTIFSPQAGNLEGNARLAAETPRQIANAHTVFNIANTIVFLPFAGQLARLAERLVPDRPLVEEEAIRARYLDSELLTTPPLALDRARLELDHLAQHTRKMLTQVIPTVLAGSKEEIDSLQKGDEAVDVLHGSIIEYLGQIGQSRLTEGQTRDWLRLMETANDLEHIGDIVETNLVGLARRRLEAGITVSEGTASMITDFHSQVLDAFDGALTAVTSQNEETAAQVVSMKSEINRLTSLAAQHHADRLTAPEPNRIEAYSVETDLVEGLKRIYYFCKRIARASIMTAETPS